MDDRRGERKSIVSQRDHSLFPTVMVGVIGMLEKGMDNHRIGGVRGDGLTAVICERFVLCYEYRNRKYVLNYMFLMRDVRMPLQLRFSEDKS